MLIPGCVSFLLTSTCLEAMSGRAAEGSCWGKAPFYHLDGPTRLTIMLRARVFCYSCKSPPPAAQWNLISGSNFHYSGLLHLPPLSLPFPLYLPHLSLAPTYESVIKFFVKLDLSHPRISFFDLGDKDLQIQWKFCVIAKVQHPNAWMKISPQVREASPELKDTHFSCININF